MTSTTVTLLDVKGMKCGGCISRARAALGGVPGFESAEFDLKEGTAEVCGDVDPQEAAQALSAIGYPAEVRGGAHG